jgi:hypothetical protein
MIKVKKTMIKVKNKLNHAMKNLNIMSLIIAYCSLSIKLSI